MSLGARVSTWWAAWQVVFWLIVVIAILAALNVWQWKRAITAPMRAEVAGLQQAQADSEQILADNQASALALREAADNTATRLRGAGKDYDNAMRAQPITNPECAPGQARMDAVNRAAGAEG